MKLTCLLISLITCCITGRAQLCTGSLGDPVVHITFGSGSNPGPPLAAATTFYTYYGSDCPNDGFYSVRSSTIGCFGSTWYALTEDHTAGDVNGYFMLVNASFQPGDFYLDTIKGLCGSTTYEFAAWVMNVLKPSACNGNGIDPNLTFKIETTTGAQLATYNTGNLAEETSPVWKQYGLFFTTPSNVSNVVVRITNNAPGGCGNDIALDDITFRPCGPSVVAGLDQTGDTSITSCEGDSTTYTIQGTYSTGYDHPVFQWQVNPNGSTWIDIPGATQTTLVRKYTGPGVFQYRLTVAESGNIGQKSCRIGSNLVTIYVNPLPVIQMQHLTEACLGSDVSFIATGGATYQWNGPNGFSSTSSQVMLNGVKFSDAGLYRLDASTDKGCNKSDSSYLVVNPVPTAALTGIDHICEGTGVQLQASGGSRYVWSPAKGLSSVTISNPFASPTDTTNYMVKAYNQFGCADSAKILMYVWKKPLANAGPDKRTKEGIPVILEGTAKGTDVSYLWTPPMFLDNANVLHPKTTLTDDFTYTLTVSSNRGCGLSTDQVFVKVFKNVVVPNAFSPNGDGVNDTWVIRGLSSYPDAVLQIYNRYGQQLFNSTGYPKAWDGTYRGNILPVGTYYYVIDLKIGEPPLNGWVLILR